MSKLSKEQWAEVEAKLSGVFGFVKLRIDGYDILLSIERIKMRLVIAVYVNGQMRGDWFNNDEKSEEARRFYAIRKKYIFPAKYRQQYKRKSKRIQNLLGTNADAVHIYPWPWWNSFKALKSHLIKNNESIELITEA